MQQPTTDANGRTYPFDLTISAASFDADLVDELREHLAERLVTTPVWEGHAGSQSPGAHDTLAADTSRVALVLHHRLWALDTAAQIDARALRDRLLRRPESVCVITLDATSPPDWLSSAPRCAREECGVAGAVEFALEMVSARGGTVREKPTLGGKAPSTSRWPEGPPPFITQPRANTSLRREFDTMGDLLDTFVAARRGRLADATVELLVLPFRLIARVEDRALSFSWIAGATASVSDGCLMVIEWTDLAPDVRGAAALRPARPLREQVYRVEASNGDDWRWRADRDNGRAYMTSHLVAEWQASISANASV